MKRRALRAAFPHTLPVLMGYLFMGIAFGILLASKGYPVGWAFLSALLILSGSMQFVAISLLVTGAFSPLNAAFFTLMVNARYLFYGLSMFELFSEMGPLRPYMIFSLTDETYSLHCSVSPPEGVPRTWFHFFIAALNHSYWVLGCTAGALFGSLLTIPTKGIDFAMTALFVVVFTDQIRYGNRKTRIAGGVGVLLSLLCLFALGREVFLIPAMGLIAAVFLTLRHTAWKEERT